MKKALLAALVAALSLSALPASATTTPAQILTFTGHSAYTIRDNSNPKGLPPDITYHFTVPAGHRFQISWSSRPYDGDNFAQGFTLVVGPYRDPGNVAVDSPELWSNLPPNNSAVKSPPSGIQTFFSYGSGHFGISVVPDEAQWTIKVIITPDPDRRA